mmetsp:Transcript_96906/g.302259  ORF Transcript_96906/g.302259 Transcript_96906/m.302259 type:complete len:215 (-) Transcript_96906:28-672(-)
MCWKTGNWTIRIEWHVVVYIEFQLYMVTIRASKDLLDLIAPRLTEVESLKKLPWALRVAEVAGCELDELSKNAADAGKGAKGRRASDSGSRQRHDKGKGSKGKDDYKGKGGIKGKDWKGKGKDYGFTNHPMNQNLANFTGFSDDVRNRRTNFHNDTRNYPMVHNDTSIHTTSQSFAGAGFHGDTDHFSQNAKQDEYGGPRTTPTPWTARQRSWG